MEKTKKCAGKCKLVLPVNEFNKNKSRKDGLEPDCRSCRRERDRLQSKKWRTKYPEKARTRLEKSNLIRAQRLINAKGGTYNPGRKDYFMRLKFYGFLCAYCRVNPSETFDHCIPVAKGGTNFASNIYPCCNRCNLEKGPKKLWSEYIPRYARGFDLVASLAGKYRVHIKAVW